MECPEDRRELWGELRQKYMSIPGKWVSKNRMVKGFFTLFYIQKGWPRVAGWKDPLVWGVDHLAPTRTDGSTLHIRPSHSQLHVCIRHPGDGGSPRYYKLRWKKIWRSSHQKPSQIWLWNPSLRCFNTDNTRWDIVFHIDSASMSSGLNHLLLYWPGGHSHRLKYRCRMVVL